ncbi:MAG: PAS domain S-box protein [Candidatus Methanoperedens sp.]|nr:PAS domain S-box protein [Candidatus Methanoperedens sp.]
MLKRFSFIPLPLITAIAIILYFVDIQTTYEPHLLLPVLNTIFTSGAGFTIAFIAASAYVFGAKRPALFLGGGALAFGISALLAGWIFPNSLNVSVTIFSMGTLLAAILYISGTGQSTEKYPARYSLKKFPRQSIAILFYSGIIIFFVILSTAAIRGLFPPFFVTGEGYTHTRWVIIISYIILFFISASLYARLYYSSKESFLYWYSLGLAIIAVGLTLAPLAAPGSPLNWLGRIAQYLGSTYFLVAAASALKEARAKGIGLAQKMDNIWREPAISYSMLVNMAKDAIISIDDKGKILVWSPAAERLFGYSQNEAIGSSFASLVAAEEQAGTLMIQSDHPNDIDNGLADRNRVELELRRKTGETFTAELSVSVKDTPSGRLRMAIIRDITERKRTEREIEHLASFPQLNPNPVIEIDANGEVTFSNAATAEALKTLKMENNVRIFLPGDFEEIMKALELEKEGQLFYRDVEIKDRIFAESIHVVKKLGVVRIYMHDITERKRAKEALRESEERYRGLIETAEEGIATHGPDGTITYVNQRMVDMLGYPREEIVGRSSLDFVGTEEREAVLGARERLKEQGSFNTERKMRRKDGSILWTLSNISPRRDAAGNFIGYLAMHSDITERKQAEEALQKAHDELELRVQERTAELKEANKALLEREASYRELTESIDDLFYAMDRGLRYTYWNKASEALTGILAKDAIGKSIYELFPDVKDTKAEQFYIEALKTQQPERFENEYQLGDKKFIFEINAYPTRDGLSVIAKDITEKKKLEAHLLRAQRMESIGVLAGGIAHNLNNLLTPMMMSLHTLKQKFKDEQSQKLLTILEKNSERSADLIKQVLSYSRGVEGERAPLNVANIVSEIEKIAKETFPRNIEIRTDIPIGIWTISGDTTQLHQVLMNLCVNARDAMLDGGILRITASNFVIDENYKNVHAEAKAGSYVAISVSDTGVGIPPKTVDRIFEPFFTTKEFGKGTGLGLSTALAIVKSHGGFINVYSEVGKGTKFNVYLPATKTEIQNVEKQQLELPFGHGELVLVAEDEDSVREVTISVLKENGYDVLAAEDGAQAVTEYAQNKDKIKVVLMDMMMPVMDGHASIRAIRKINPEVKIIAASGLAEKDKLAKIESTRAQTLLPKPYTAERLLKTIHEVLSAK